MIRVNVFFASCPLTIILVIIIVILEGEACAVWAERVLYGRSDVGARRTDDGGHVVKGSYVLTRPLEALSSRM